MGFIVTHTHTRARTPCPRKMTLANTTVYHQLLSKGGGIRHVCYNVWGCVCMNTVALGCSKRQRRNLSLTHNHLTVSSALSFFTADQIYTKSVSVNFLVRSRLNVFDSYKCKCDIAFTLQLSLMSKLTGHDMNVNEWLTIPQSSYFFPCKCRS